MPATSVDVTLPHNITRVPNNNTGAHIRQREYEHESCTLSIVGVTGASLRLRTFDPITVRCTAVGGGSMTFVGYIHHVRESQDGLSSNSSDRTHTIVALGPSMVMKDAHQAIWTDVTLSDIARTLATRYSFAADIDDDLSPRLSMVSQRGESDWVFLCRLAKKYGAVVFCRGTTLTVRARNGRVAARRLQAQSYVFGASSASGNDIQQFEALLSDASPLPSGMRAQRTANGVIGRDLFSATNSGAAQDATRGYNPAGLFNRFLDDVALGTPDKAGALLDGQAANAAQSYRAAATLLGRTSVVVGSAVYVSGLRSQYDGYWDVVEVNHNFDDSFSYTVDVELSTSSLGDPLVGSGVPTVTAPGDAAPTSILGVPQGATSANSPGARWRASSSLVGGGTVVSSTAPRIAARIGL